MLVAASLRHRVDGFLFQSSYPLDAHHKSFFKRIAHRGLIRVASRGVTGVLAVSPLGLERARALCSPRAHGLVVPLLSDLPQSPNANEALWGGTIESVRFIYAGTHAPRRRLDIVLEGVVAALEEGIDAAFLFVGGKEQEVELLREACEIQAWERSGRIRFLNAVPRPELPSLLSGADVGMSLVPRTDVNREMSPTKLAEYLGAGLAVLASHGVDVQEFIVNQSDAGILVNFNVDDIHNGISFISARPDWVLEAKVRGEQFAKKHLRYSAYVPALMSIVTAGNKSP
jgi:glycosyltransferase involved in cell wall biosynthesis